MNVDGQKVLRTLSDYFSAKTLNYSFRPQLNPDLKSSFKLKLRLTLVLAKSCRLKTKSAIGHV